ncbi:MAG: hypothetical protein CMK78_13390 [Pseudomonadales bacterium]|nr:hypothetical protein [Pseudomonadales bacterium]
MNAAQIIPFSFDKKEVRTTLINDQPWFVAKDVAAALEYREADRFTRWLDSDEKGTHIVGTPGGDQEMLVINESGLYSAILRSRKAEAKRFKKWVTAEVLPAIRKHGRYEDRRNQMGALVLEAIGVSELTAIKGVISDKAKHVPKERRLGFMQTMHRRLHTRFNVARTELIPHKDFADACNFVAAYSLEGEWLPKEEKREQFDDWLNLNALISCMRQSYEIFAKHDLYKHLTGLGSRAGIEIHDYLADGRGIAGMLKRQYADPLGEAERQARAICDRALATN